MLLIDGQIETAPGIKGYRFGALTAVKVNDLLQVEAVSGSDYFEQSLVVHKIGVEFVVRQ